MNYAWFHFDKGSDQQGNGWIPAAAEGDGALGEGISDLPR